MQWTEVRVEEDYSQGDKRGAIENLLRDRQSKITQSCGMVAAALYGETLLIVIGHSRFFHNTFELLLCWAEVATQNFGLPLWKTGAYFDLSEEDGFPIITQRYEKMRDLDPAVEILILFALKERMAKAINKLENLY